MREGGCEPKIREEKQGGSIQADVLIFLSVIDKL